MAARAPDWPEPQAEGGLHAYWHAVRAHRVLVAVVAVLTLAASAAYLAVRTPTFTTTAQLLVNPLPQEDNTFLGLPVIRDSGDPTRTIQTAASLLRSPRTAAATAERLGGEATVRGVLGAVQIQPEGQSNILDVVASASSAAAAKRLADVYTQTVVGQRDADLDRAAGPVIAALQAERARQRDDTATAADLDSRIGELEGVRRAGDPTTTVAQLAMLPDRPEGAPPWLVMALALFGGAILGSVAAMLIELLMPSRLRDAAELGQVDPVPVLVHVPPLGRAVRRRLRTSPLAFPRPVLAALRDLHLQLCLHGGEHRTLLFTGPSARDGRTTSVVAFALELAEAGQRVVLIDLDLRGADLATSLGVEPDRTLEAALEPRGRLADALLPVPGLPGVQVAAGVADARFALLDRARRRLPGLLEEARTLASYVLIDCSPLGEVGDALPLVRAVDDVILVARCDHSRVAAIETTRDLLRRAGKPATGYVLVGSRRATRGLGEPPAVPSEELPLVHAAGPPRASAGTRWDAGQTG